MSKLYIGEKIITYPEKNPLPIVNTITKSYYIVKKKILM